MTSAPLLAFGPAGTAAVALAVVTMSWMACWCSSGAVIAVRAGRGPGLGVLHGLFGPLGILVLMVRARRWTLPPDSRPGHTSPAASHSAGRVRPQPALPQVEQYARATAPVLTVRPVAPITGRPGRGASLASVVVMAMALTTLLLEWVGGFSPEQASSLEERASGLVVDPTWLPRFDPDQFVRISGWSLGPVGPFLTGVVCVGIVMALVATRTRRSSLHVALAVLASIVATLLGLAMCLIEWINLESVPLADRLPDEVQSYLPDLRAGPGLRLFVLAAGVTAVLAAVAAVRTATGHRRPQP